MSPRYLIPSKVLKVLVEQGLVPADCSNLTIELPANGLLALHYTVTIQPEHLEKLGAAFSQMHELLTLENR